MLESLIDEYTTCTQTLSNADVVKGELAYTHKLAVDVINSSGVVEGVYSKASVYVLYYIVTIVAYDSIHYSRDTLTIIKYILRMDTIFYQALVNGVASYNMNKENKELTSLETRKVRNEVILMLQQIVEKHG